MLGCCSTAAMLDIVVAVLLSSFYRCAFGLNCILMVLGRLVPGSLTLCAVDVQPFL
jgi:hypothetical protein